MAKARTVVLEKPAQEYLDEEIRKCPMVEKYLWALEYQISRKPESVGVPVGHLSDSHYVIKSQPFRIPVPLVLTIVYRFTENETFIEFARVDQDPPY